MKKVRFSEEQMVATLREAEARSLAEIARKHGISELTICNWRRHFAGLQPTDIKRLRTTSNARRRERQTQTLARRARSRDRYADGD